jgi:sugar lactone lactonase YvrE
VSVRFTPAVVTTTAASLVVTATPGGRASAALTGTGVQPAALAATPTALTFAGRLLATASAAQGVALRNGGALASGAVMARLEGSHPGDFAVTSSCGVLGASGMCTLDVTFRPTARGTRTATLRLEANPGGAAFVNLVGEGLAPATLIASPASLSFGALPVGSSHGGLTARISNTGDAPSGGLMLVRGGTHAGDFAISPATTCGPALAGGGSCDVALTFSPTNTGARGASLVVSSAPGGMVTLPLSGTGLQPARLAVAPAALTFAERLEGSTSGALQVAVSNLGDAATGVPAVTLGGSHPDDFSISSGCTAPVLPAASCTVGVTFTPRAAGARGATLAVSASPGGTATVALSGSGRQTEVAYASGLFGSVALHPDGTTLYFADWATGQIFRGDTSGGARVLLAGTGITDFRGLCLSQVGNPTYLYAMANPHGRLMRVTMASGFVDEIFPSPPIAAPHACVVSHDGGTLYVGDTITQRVYSMPAPGGATVVHTEPFGVPVQMLLDKSGSTIYATNDTPYVYRFPSGTPGTAPVLLNPGGGLTKSTGIALSADEQRLFVADDAGFVSALPARLVWLPSAGGTATPFFTASTALRSPVFMVMEPSGERLWVGDPGHLGTPGVHVFALPLSLR